MLLMRIVLMKLILDILNFRDKNLATKVDNIYNIVHYYDK